MEKYKRFMVFAGYHYYPCGGTCDCENSFDTEKEAIEWVNKDSNYDWSEIFDRVEGITVEPV